jgi:hypothetical protein
MARIIIIIIIIISSSSIYFYWHRNDFKIITLNSFRGSFVFWSHRPSFIVPHKNSEIFVIFMLGLCISISTLPRWRGLWDIVALSSKPAVVALQIVTARLHSDQ